jgi:hypothetical protein
MLIISEHFLILNYSHFLGTKMSLSFTVYTSYCMGTAVAQWLRYCAKNQKVTGSFPDGVMEFFVDIHPFDRTMALGSTQPLTEMSTRSISWG